VRSMLSRRFRLTKRGSFNYVYRKGKSARGRNLSLIYTTGKDAPRIGFSVSNKIGKAVVRNKLKRRMRAVVGSVLNRIAPCQAVFAAKVGAGEMDFCQIEKEIIGLLNKSGLLKPSDGKEKE